MEAVKDRIQTQLGFARRLSDGLPKIVKSEGALGYDACYVAGILCTVVTQLADNLVSFHNKAKEATIVNAVNKLAISALFTRGLPLCIVMIGTLSGT
ncbi:Mitochondrial phosphate carrier protein 2, mitochondrial [Dendrobium catenatum]|uniref:Mitochondrial phosphate carrier protein 2, mitochondrial n=1 Tax=Dendrobium catenatum TaxID=906689 RepID=A0A2I0VCD6_9ASPA|nr:Mitochondrial phosphate carrier protein 2, mitochondrial [Dendrobium catenatum]